MVRNYLLIAFRNIAKRKLFAFINSFGLCIGIGFCMLIYLYIRDEKSFDQFHRNKDRIYRLQATTYSSVRARSGNPYATHCYMPARFGEVILDELAEVEAMTRFEDGSGILRYNDKVFTERFHFVDSGFFKMFSFPLVSGSERKLFVHPTDIVLTASIARKYFGDEDPVGKEVMLDVDGVKTFTVAAVMQDPPHNSSLVFKILVPIEAQPRLDGARQQWASFSYPTFIELRPKADTAALHGHLEVLTEKYMGERLKKWRERENIPAGKKAVEFGYRNLTEIHLDTRVSWDNASDPRYAMILEGIAILILVIACINYISLALTASAARRVEVGIRKVVGARSRQLVYQFGLESIVIGFLSMLLGLVLAVLALPAFNQFTGKGITLDPGTSWRVAVAGVVIAVGVGLVAGSYPAVFLSRFLPARVLKGQFTARMRAGFAKPLVVLQFFLSAVLIVSSVVMYRQMRYITTKDLGYNKEQVLVIGTQTGWNKEADAVVERFRARAIGDSQIAAVSGTSSSFNQGWSRYGYKIKGEDKSAYVYRVDPDYVPLLGIQLVAGRNFDGQRASDSTALIVNEALVKDMEWKDPLLEHLNWREDSVGIGAAVIGVVKDYHFLSLEKEIEPMFLSMDKKHVGFLMNLLVKVTPGDLPEKLEHVKNVWAALNPDKPFDCTFLDQDVARQYEKYDRWMKVMGLSTGFAILIACMGLFGLSGINALNRAREIGIRKVFGAEVSSIFILLNRQFVGLALIAFAIATPVSWYAMNKWWLSNFQFKVVVGWELFVFSMAAGLLLALATVSYHALRASNVNPAETLKYE